MSTKVRLTKNEHKKQKDALKMFQRYLPTLILKKKQLQREIRHTEARMVEIQETRQSLENKIDRWVSLFGECVGALSSFPLSISSVAVASGNIAGVEIPVFEGVTFTAPSHDLLETPPWIDEAEKQLREVVELCVEERILAEQLLRLTRELRLTSQRVNLFEKVKIPQTRENIRRIAVFLGDQQTASVVRGKISKKLLVGGAA